MPEQNQDNEIPKNIKRTKKRVWLAASIIIIATIICCLFCKTGLLWNFQSVDKQLAAIEAARAIPDEENAAIIYNQLLEDYDESLLSPDFMDDDLDDLTRREPWLSKDYPQVAEWLQQHKNTIATLMEASKKEKCRFPIITDLQQRTPWMKRLSAMRRWAFLLIRAANNDIAEDRIDAGIDKWRCLIQMGAHLRQQPLLVEYLVALAIEAVGLHQTVVFLVEGNADETHLRKVETLPLRTEDDWTAVLEEVLPAEELTEQKWKEKLGLLDRLKYEFNYGLFGSMKGPDYNQIHQLSLRGVATCRGIRILIALRRDKNKNSRWPESLEDIKSIAPEEIFVDPFNNGSFVYKLTNNNFELYSKGKNNIDEDGEYRSNWPEKAEPDDWPIWPTYYQRSKATKENTNGK